MLHRFSFFLLILIALAGCQGLSSEPRIVATSAPIDTARDDIAATMTLGGEVWMANCAECHGRVGAGSDAPNGAPLPDITAYTDEQILASITNGNDIMPAFGELLSSEELAAAMTYAKMMSLAISRGMVNAEAPAPVATAETSELAENVPPVVSTAEVSEIVGNVPPIVTGIVIGQLTNGTTGAVLPPSQPITLHVIESEILEETFEAITNADDSYRFEGVPFDAEFQYVITAPYGDVQYVSEIVTVDPAALEMALPITVYESGATAGDITITAMSSQVMVSTNVMQVIQLASFTNTSDRVFFSVTNGIGTSVQLQIPQNASMLNSVSERYRVTDNTISDTRPVLPGESHLIHVAYSLPYGASALIDQPLSYPLNGRVDVVMATDGLSASGDGFAPQAPITSGEMQLDAYGGTFTLEAGSSLRFEVTGTPVAAPETVAPVEVSSVTPVAYILIGAGISALLIAAFTLIRDRSKATKTTTTIAGLMEQIAALDSNHKAGQVNSQEYKRQRSALKDQLTALMKAQS